MLRHLKEPRLGVLGSVHFQPPPPGGQRVCELCAWRLRASDASFSSAAAPARARLRPCSRRPWPKLAPVLLWPKRILHYAPRPLLLPLAQVLLLPPQEPAVYWDAARGDARRAPAGPARSAAGGILPATAALAGLE